MERTNTFPLANVKTALARAAAVALIAGAALLAAPTPASAQVAFGFRTGHVAVGVGIPGPVYLAPRPYYPAPVYAAVAPGYGYYGPRIVYGRRFDWRDRRDGWHDRHFDR